MSKSREPEALEAHNDAMTAVLSAISACRRSAAAWESVAQAEPNQSKREPIEGKARVMRSQAEHLTWWLPPAMRPKP